MQIYKQINKLVLAGKKGKMSVLIAILGLYFTSWLFKLLMSILTYSKGPFHSIERNTKNLNQNGWDGTRTKILGNGSQTHSPLNHVFNEIFCYLRSLFGAT